MEHFSEQEQSLGVIRERETDCVRERERERERDSEREREREREFIRKRCPQHKRWRCEFRQTPHDALLPILQYHVVY